MAMAVAHAVVPPFLRACRTADHGANLLLIGAASALIADIVVGSSGLRGVLMGVSLLAGLAEKYFALRVNFDLELFQQLAEGKLEIRELDRGLARFFRKPAPTEPRDWESRVDGAVVLARRQLTAFGVQGIALALAAMSLVVGTTSE